VLEKWQISDFEYHVKVKHKGKEYSNNFSLPGLKLLVAKLDNKSKDYAIKKAMLNAVSKTAKAEEVEDVNSKDNQEG
jgi:hypothetical protein